MTAIRNTYIRREQPPAIAVSSVVVVPCEKEAHRRISFEQQEQERAVVAVMADVHADGAAAKSSNNLSLLAKNAGFAVAAPRGAAAASGNVSSASGLAAPGDVYYKRVASLESSSSTAAAAFGVEAPTINLNLAAAKKWQSAAAASKATEEKNME